MQSARNEVTVFSDTERAREIITAAYINMMNKNTFSVIKESYLKHLDHYIKAAVGDADFNVTLSECEKHLSELKDYISRNSTEKSSIIKIIAREIFNFITSIPEQEIKDHFTNAKNHLLLKNWNFSNFLLASFNTLSMTTWFASLCFLGISSMSGLFYFVRIPALALSFNSQLVRRTTDQFRSGDKKIDLLNNLMKSIYPENEAQDPIDFFLKQLTSENKRRYPHIAPILSAVYLPPREPEPYPSSSDTKEPTLPKALNQKRKNRTSTTEANEEVSKQTETQKKDEAVYNDVYKKDETTYIKVSPRLFFKHDPKTVEKLVGNEKIANRVLNTVDQQRTINAATSRGKIGLKWVGKDESDFSGYDAKLKLSGSSSVGGGLRIGYAKRSATEDEVKLISGDKVEILSPRMTRRK